MAEKFDKFLFYTISTIVLTILFSICSTSSLAKNFQPSKASRVSTPDVSFLYPLLLETSSATSSIIFFEDFSDDLADQQWQVKNNSPIASSWAVLNGAYVQSKTIEDQTFVETYRLGTYSFLTSGLDLTDYEFSADATFKEEKRPDDIGVMFRYQDDDNYYRVTFNGRYGFCRLEKKKNGRFSTLGVNARGYKMSETLHIKIRASGNMIQVFLNGNSLFSVIDDSHSIGTIALYTQVYSAFDNVLIKEVDTLPKVAISNPLSHIVYGDNNLTASAHVTGSGIVNPRIKFILDDSIFIDVSSAPFTVQFSNVEPGEHSLKAVLYNFDTAVSSANRQKVGTGGDYYITVGDSITNGWRDFYALDNISSDLRIISTQGFQAPLSNLLTEHRSLPQIVFNEGISGDKSSDAANKRISSILERHPRSNKVLILLGTNDSSDTLPISSSAFRKNMQKLIDQIPSEKSIWVGLVPPNFRTSDPLSDPRNKLMQDYNEEIKNNLNGINIGPDFFGFFIGAGVNRSSLFSSAKHPNSLGYRVMAHLWNNVLTNQNILPLFVDGLSPNNYKQNLLEEGNTYYVDRDWVLMSIPEVLKDGVWIMTSRSNRTNQSDEYLSFKVDRRVDVYVAYDSSARQYPQWLNAYTLTNLVIRTTDGISDFKVFKRSDVTGKISLGGNQAPPADSGTQNYLVILKERQGKRM